VAAILAPVAVRPAGAGDFSAWPAGLLFFFALGFADGSGFERALGFGFGLAFGFGFGFAFGFGLGFAGFGLGFAFGFGFAFGLGLLFFFDGIGSLLRVTFRGCNWLAS
jgi:hypothetical protein